MIICYLARFLSDGTRVQFGRRYEPAPPQVKTFQEQQNQQEQKPSFQLSGLMCFSVYDLGHELNNFNTTQHNTIQCKMMQCKIM